VSNFTFCSKREYLSGFGSHNMITFLGTSSKQFDANAVKLGIAGRTSVLCALMGWGKRGLSFRN
jgi:hypothetical protein